MEKKKPWARKKIKKMRAKNEDNLSAEKVKKVEILGIALLAIAAICACGLVGFNVGFMGLFFANSMYYFFGVGAWIATFLLAIIGVSYMFKHNQVINMLGISCFFVLILSIYHHFVIPFGEEILPNNLPKGGGILGGMLLFIVRKFFGEMGSIIVLSALALGVFIWTTTWSLKNGLFKTKETAEKTVNFARNSLEKTYTKMSKQMDGKTKKENPKNSFYNQEKDNMFQGENKKIKGEYAKKELLEPIRQDEISSEIELHEENRIEVEEKGEIIFSEVKNEEIFNSETEIKKDEIKEMPFTIEYSQECQEIENIDDVQEEFEEEKDEIKESFEEIGEVKNNMTSEIKESYYLPEINKILKRKIKQKNVELEQEIAQKAQVLAKTLENFKVQAIIVNACHGPAVTRYELELAPGVKVSKITNLSDDLALALAAFSVRIEPIPGKAVIGVEVPNKDLEGVQLIDVLESMAFMKATSKLTVGLGMDIGGQAILADLAKMPHLLVAGATGSGKSVCINTLITSILFKATPNEVKFILIDPKMVELSNYNGIPHLMVPVVTDARKAASVLNWAVQEMEKRYSLFATNNVRDMERYNKLDGLEKMPAIVIIIDELADLMMVAPHDVEDAICRLAQKARAAGIHLVLATQRPSVDVITGIIKANIPSRISFAVSSQIDSRTILDMSGAEKLLGKGDMLFYPVGAAKPQRVQGAFISDSEVERLLNFIKAQGQEVITNEEIISFTENQSKKDKRDKSVEQDELLIDAVKLVLSTGQASSSSIQRKFRIGYTRAARLIDTMEELHIIGPGMGSKPREILMTTEEAMRAISE